MKVIVRFITKGSSPSIKDAVRIAEACEHYIEASEYYVHFDSPDANLQKLLDLVGSWKTTQIFIDDEEVNAKKIQRVLFCPSKLLCQGICNHIKIGGRTLDTLVKEYQEREDVIHPYHAILIEEGNAFVDERTIRELTPFLEGLYEKKFRLDKEKLNEWINDEFSLELRYCEKINVEKILDIINNLPETFEEVDVHKVRNTLRCPDKFFCKGVCTHLKFGGISVAEFLKNNVKNDVGVIDKLWTQKIMDFLKGSNDKKKVVFDREAFKEHVTKELSFEFEHCKIIDKNKTVSLIEKLPEKFEVVEDLSLYSLLYREAESPNIYPEELPFKEEFEGLTEERIKKFAEIFADVFEGMLRKIIKEMKKK